MAPGHVPPPRWLPGTRTPSPPTGPSSRCSGASPTWRSSTPPSSGPRRPPSPATPWPGHPRHCLPLFVETKRLHIGFCLLNHSHESPKLNRSLETPSQPVSVSRWGQFLGRYLPSAQKTPDFICNDRWDLPHLPVGVDPPPIGAFPASNPSTPPSRRVGPTSSPRDPQCNAPTRPGNDAPSRPCRPTPWQGPSSR